MARRTDTTDMLCAHRGAVLHFVSDPGTDDDPRSFEYIEDGMLLVKEGLIVAAGSAATLLPRLSVNTPVIEHGDNILLPGFVDTHIHYPQTDVIASGGRQLLDWLEDYTFPTEAKFGDVAVAAEVAEFFLDELARNGTTTAMVFCTVHQASVNAFFAAAQKRRLCMIAGKVLMDSNCPDELRDSVIAGERQSRELLERWHGCDRLLYAITPRFAPTSSVQQLASTGRLAADFPDAFIQSHLAENHDEIAWVKRLFPEARSYLDVYDRCGLLRERAVYAHCIHLNDADRARMAQSGAVAAFCPTSNLYLGSGLFDIDATDRSGMCFAMGTDVGGGSSFSMLRTLSEAYKVAQLKGQRLSPLRAFYLATLGGARCLGLDHKIGRFSTGMEADFIVLDRRATPLIARRTAQARNLDELLRVLMILGDDRVIAATYIMGQAQYRRAANARVP